ncbi:MAG: hypothetical protein ACOYYJ_04090, partial [Chloroflexota bacterium]
TIVTLRPKTASITAVTKPSPLGLRDVHIIQQTLVMASDKCQRGVLLFEITKPSFTETHYPNFYIGTNLLFFVSL